MSIKIMSWVFESGPLDASERLVLLALADYAADNGEWSPSMAGIAAKAGMTERGARGVVRRLEAAGWIEVRVGGGRGGRSHYRITMQNPERQTRNAKPGMPNPEQDDRKPGTRRQETRNGGSAEPSGTIKEPSEIVERARGSRLSPEWFLPMEWGEWALSEGMDRETIRFQAEKFRDYWISRAGKGGVKADWRATWRNWIRSERERAGGNYAARRAPKGPEWLDPAIAQIARLASAGATSGDDSDGVGSPFEKGGSLWMGP